MKRSLLFLFFLLPVVVFAQTSKYAVIVSEFGAETAYDSLTQAVAAVQSGDTVQIYPGVHVVTPGYTPGAHGIGSAPMQLWDKTNIAFIGIGNKAVIQGDGPGDFMLIRGCRDIVIENLTFRGNKPEIISNQLFATINFSGTNENIRISKCSFLDQGNHAISHLWGDKTTRGVEISSCHFVNGGDLDGRNGDTDGAAVSGIGSEWNIANNRIDSYVRGIEIESSGPSVIENVNITGNILTDVVNLGIMVFASSGDSTDFKNILISGNQIRDSWTAEAINGVPIFISGGENITITENLVRRAKAAGIYMTTVSADIRNCIIAHNQVENCAWRGIQVYAISGRAVDNILIDGNYVADCSSSGILALGDNLTIVNNLLHNNSKSAGHVGAGIEIYGGSSNAMIMGNRCWDTRTTMLQDYGIWLRSGVNNTMLRDNWLVDNLTANLQDDSSGTDSFGNRTTDAADEVYVEINTAGGDVALTWPRSSLSYTVQVASNVLPLVWTDATNVVSVVDDKNFTIVPSEYDGNLYRLHGE